MLKLLLIGLLTLKKLNQAMKNKIGLLIVSLLTIALFALEPAGKKEYVCMPCGNECDKTVYSEAGTCPMCKMQLVDKTTIHFNNIQPEEICEYIAAHPQAILLDVRTKEEFEGKANPDFGTLKNSINLPVQVLESKISELDQYKEKEIIVYCSHSHRSPMASWILTQHGFNNVTNMLGGMSVLKDSTCRK
jgi:rhodanese-related sulfurtransferase/DNA-directed RNA polymerase subunit RPC12/RpoP